MKINRGTFSVASFRRHAREWIAYLAREGLVLGSLVSCSLREIERKCGEAIPITPERRRLLEIVLRDTITPLMKSTEQQSNSIGKEKDFFPS